MKPGDADVGRAVSRLLDAAARLAPASAWALVDEVCQVMSASAGRLYAADYSSRRLQQVDRRGHIGEPQSIAGTIAGRAFMSGQVVVSDTHPTVVSVPLVDGSNKIGVLELDYERWEGAPPALLEHVVEVFVLLLVANNRYSDFWARARRSEPLSAGAEIQWDVLPPLSCSTNDVAVSGILEPAYSIGGDSFDYALNGRWLEFAIVDAIGHDMSAVLMSAAAINGFRNVRRAGSDVSEAYEVVDRLIAKQFGDSFYVTGQIGALDVATGILTWVNAGHVAPMLVRNGTYAGELDCSPSMPFGLGGPIVEVATASLQRGDRVLFYTDGITESRSPDGAFFGRDRLSDFLVRSTLEQVDVTETVRRLALSVVDYVGTGLRDDATLLLIEYRGADQPA